MKPFAGIDIPENQKEKAAVWLQSVPYDGTSTWGKGADQGFKHFLEAAENMELFDIETQSEPIYQGVHCLPEWSGLDSPESMFKHTYTETQALLESEKLLTFFGGEHSISIGVIKAFYEKYPDLTVLQLDAHTDLRPSYDGTPYNHACALHDASQHTNLIQVGIRSMDGSENDFLNPDQCFFAHDMNQDPSWAARSIDLMTNPVYITLDLDVLDPSIMPATGTPEPGGLSWYQITGYLHKVFATVNVVGFDIVELAPIPGLRAPNYLAAKLYYKMLSYYFTYAK